MADGGSGGRAFLGGHLPAIASPGSDPDTFQYGLSYFYFYADENLYPNEHFYGYLHFYRDTFPFLDADSVIHHHPNGQPDGNSHHYRHTHLYAHRNHLPFTHADPDRYHHAYGYEDRYSNPNGYPDSYFHSGCL
jgi:hypothetical protein